MGAKIFEILTYFIIYSFLGWIMESIVRSVSEKKINKYGLFEGTSLSDLWNRSYYYVTISRKVSEQAYLIIFYSHYCTNYMGVLSGSFIRKNISYKILGLF